MKNKKYTKENTTLQTFGSGKNKKFVLYADWNPETRRWGTQVHPDIQGNTAKATAQALRWLNSDVEVREPHILRNHPSKFQFMWRDTYPPSHFLETDERGIAL